MHAPNIQEPQVPLRIIELLDALQSRQRSALRHQQAVALIGPGNAGPRECEAAYAIAYPLARAGIAIVCGGRGGVMQAAAQGAYDAGGISIGLLPEEDTRSANPYLSVALPTGMGEMRNALIVRSAVCIVAVGCNPGTLTEITMGLAWKKPMFTLHADLALEGIIPARDTQHALELVLAQLLS